MPLYVMTCDKCQLVQKHLTLTPEMANAGVPCKRCGALTHRTPTPPTVHNKEVLRFGHQVRDVEKFTDSEQLYDERAHQDDRRPK